MRKETVSLKTWKHSRAHKLAIEGGRYMNILKHERMYTACNTGDTSSCIHDFFFSVEPIILPLE